MKVLVRVRYKKNSLDDKIKIKGISTLRPPIGRDQCALTDSGPTCRIRYPFRDIYSIVSRATTLITLLIPPVSEVPALVLITFFTTACREVRGALVTNKISCGFPHKLTYAVSSTAASRRPLQMSHSHSICRQGLSYASGACIHYDCLIKNI